MREEELCVVIKKTQKTKNQQDPEQRPPPPKLQDLFALLLPSVWGVGKVGGELVFKNLVEIFQEPWGSCYFPFCVKFRLEEGPTVCGVCSDPAPISAPAQRQS